MSFLARLATQSTISQSAVQSAVARSRSSIPLSAKVELVEQRASSRVSEVAPSALASFNMLSPSSGSAFSSGGVSDTESSAHSGHHSRKRLDETLVDVRHRKTLERSRRYQEKMRSSKSLDGMTDDQLMCLLLSKKGKEQFPQVSALVQQGQAEAAAAKAVKEIVQSFPYRSAHKQAFVGKLRGKMTSKQFQEIFTSISDRYARKAAKAVRDADANLQEGVKLKKPDIFSQQVMANAEREKITPMEKRITASVVKENLAGKSGSNAAFWFGSLDSFFNWFRTTAHPQIYAQMVEESGGFERLAHIMRGGKWNEQNSAAYLCKGGCVRPGSTDVCHHNYVPRNRKTVGKILKEEDVLFRCITKTVPCKWHDNWDKWKAELLREEALTEEKRNLEKIKNLKEKIKKCERHDAQYKVQRSHITRQIDLLEPGLGAWVVYQDYISWYSETGVKMNDLLFTRVTRRTDGELQYEYIHNIMRCEHSGATTRYIWDYHMRTEEEGGSGEMSSLPGPGIRTGDGGGDFHNRECIMAESKFWQKYNIEMRSDMLCGGHAWNVCDADKGIHTKVFLTSQLEQGRGFDIVEDWLLAAAKAGFENHRYYGHDRDVIEAWISKNKENPRKVATWMFQELRSFVYYRPTDEGKIFTPGVAYGAVHSDVEFRDRIVLDLRQDKDAKEGKRCEKCTQSLKYPVPAHKKDERCKSKHQSLGEPALAIHVKSGATDGMSYEEKQSYFNSVSAASGRAKSKAKGRFTQMLKPECIALLKGLGLSTQGKVADLQQRLEDAMASHKGRDGDGDGGNTEGGAGKSSKKKANKKAGRKRKQPGNAARGGPSSGAAVRGSRPAGRGGAAKRQRRAARPVNYQESDHEEDQKDSDWDEGDANSEGGEIWLCKHCNHPNSNNPPPGSEDYVGCELCEPPGGFPDSSSEDEALVW